MRIQIFTNLNILVFLLTINIYGLSILEFETCQNVNGNYDAIGILPAFGHDDVKFYGWVNFGYVYEGHSVEFKLYRPNGSHYGTVTSSIEDPGNKGYDYWEWYVNYCWWEVKGYDIADVEGVWSLELWVDGRQKREIEFTMRYNLTDHKMCKDVQANDPYNPISATSVFKQTDDQALAWTRLDTISNPLEFKVDFYEPNGTLYLEDFNSTPDPNSEGWDYYYWYKVWSGIYIKDSSAANKCGDWHADVYIKDCWGGWDKEYTENFKIIEDPPQNPTVNMTYNPTTVYPGDNITLNATANDNTYIKEITFYWNDGDNHTKKWDNIFNSSINKSHNIGNYQVGEQIEYWTVVKDTSGNQIESPHNQIVIQSLPLPEIPSEVVATDGTYSNKIVVTWNTSDNATKYQVFKNTNNNNDTATSLSGETSDLIFNDVVIIPGQTNFYWVKAGNNYGWSDFSQGDSGHTPALPLYHPADINQDWQINIDELTAYSAAWQRGDSWPVPPNPIDLVTVTNAVEIWKKGEYYEDK